MTGKPGDPFVDMYNATHGVLPPEEEAVDRGRRESNMRSPHGVKHHPRHKGDRVQFNRKMRRKLKEQIVAACKRLGIDETAALEEAFTLWLASKRKGASQ